MAWEDQFSFNTDDADSQTSWSEDEGLLRHMTIDIEALDEAELDAWKMVFGRSRDLYKKKPWLYLHARDAIAIEKDSGSFEVSIASMLGNAGRNAGVQFFLGDWGQWSLQYLLSREAELSARLVSRLLSRLNAYRLDFLMRADIPDHYAALARHSGFSFRGSWPYFTVLEPNRPLRYPKLEDLRHLSFLLEQLLHTISDIETSRVSFSPDEKKILKRSWSAEDQRWLYSQRDASTDLYLPAVTEVDEFTVKRMERLPQTDAELSLDLFRFRHPVRDKDGSFINLYLFVATDDLSGEVVSFDTLRSDVDEYQSWPDFVVRLLDEVGRPALIALDDEIALASIDSLLEAFDIPYTLLWSNPLHDLIFDNITDQMKK